MDRLEELEVLNAIVHAGSLRQAALRLRRSPASITRALARLEERFGIRLVNRTTRRVSPTEAGCRLADQARDILDGYRALAAAQSPAVLRGLVRVTATPLFGRLFAAPAMDEFLEAWPEIQAELLFDDRYLDMIEHRIDAALRIGPLPDSSLRVRPLGQIRWITVCSPDYLAANGAPERPDDLPDHAVIMEPWVSGGPEWRFQKAGREASVALSPRLISSDTDVQLGAARRGRGIAQVYTFHAAADLERGSLVRVLQPYESADIPVQLVTLPGRHAPARARAVADHLTQTMRARLSALNNVIPRE